MKRGHDIVETLCRLGMNYIDIMQQVKDQSDKEPHVLTIFNKVSFDSIYMLENGMYVKDWEDPSRFEIMKTYARITNKNDIDSSLEITISHNEIPVFTQRELFNLLQMRAVFKKALDLDMGAWYLLDYNKGTREDKLKVRTIRRTFNVEQALSIYKIKEAENERVKSAIVLSLQKGNKHPVTIVRPNSIQRYFIAANPLIETINIQPMQEDY